jgi:trehalose/maltose hydrolase-like predicted phosphorylase
MQGGNVAGGLGLDKEFFESILVPQVMLYGFLGFQPTADGFVLQPQLPKEWPELAITRIHLHGCVLDISVRDNAVTVTGSGRPNEQLVAELAPGWQLAGSSSGFVTTK